MNAVKQDVLILPKKHFEGHYAFLNWDFAEERMSEMQSDYKWCNRVEAETSIDWVQPIPCAIIRDRQNRYCAFRRIQNTRHDLKGKVSLVIGGHIDKIEFPEKEPVINDLFLMTLLREIEEEISVEILSEAVPLGVVIDNSSVVSLRHIGILYEVSISNPIEVAATEEFSKRSNMSGQFFSANDLLRYHAQMDPWSKLIFEDLIKPVGITNSPRQQGLLKD